MTNIIATFSSTRNIRNGQNAAVGAEISHARLPPAFVRPVSHRDLRKTNVVVAVRERKTPGHARGCSLKVGLLRVTSETERYDSGVRVYVYGHRAVLESYVKGEERPTGSACFSVHTYS